MVSVRACICSGAKAQALAKPRRQNARRDSSCCWFIIIIIALCSWLCFMCCLSSMMMSLFFFCCCWSVIDLFFCVSCDDDVRVRFSRFPDFLVFRSWMKLKYYFRATFASLPLPLSLQGQAGSMTAAKRKDGIYFYKVKLIICVGRDWICVIHDLFWCAFLRFLDVFENRRLLAKEATLSNWGAASSVW